MLSGLKENQAKMSKSDPNSAIFMEDSRVISYFFNFYNFLKFFFIFLILNFFQEDVDMKIKKAFCEEKIIVGNPVMEYSKFIIFGSIGYFELRRPEKYGGNM